MQKQPVKHTSNRGVLIAIEGIDGSGKTTQAILLRNRLVSEGYRVATSKEPTSSPFGMKIKEMGKNGRHPEISEEFKNFLEDRKHDVEYNIRPALEKGLIVIVDRYYYSSMAYQGARGMSPEDIEGANLEFASKPDIVILLDITPQEARRRIQSRNEGTNHFEERLSPVRKIFLDISQTHPEIVKIDGQDDVKNIQSRIYSIVKPLLAKYEE